INNTNSCIHSRCGNNRCHKGLSTENGVASDISCSSSKPDVHCQGGQDYSALNCFFPIWTGAQERQGSADGPEQNDADECAPHSTAAPGNGRTPYYNGGYNFHLQPYSGVALNLGESDGIEQGGSPDHCAANGETPEDNSSRLDSYEPCRLKV